MAFINRVYICTLVINIVCIFRQWQHIMTSTYNHSTNHSDILFTDDLFIFEDTNIFAD